MNITNLSFSLLLSLIASFAFSSLYLGSRLYFGLDPNLQLILESSCVYYFLTVSILLIIHNNNFRPINRVLLALIVFSFPYLGLLFPLFTRITINALGSFSFFYALRNGLTQIKDNLKVSIIFLISFLSYAIWVNSYFSTWTGVFSPIFSIELAELGVLHKDILYMSSMISMIKNHFIVSTGIHGLVKNEIHFLPLYWHAAISNAQNTNAILSLCTNAYLILTPLFFVIFLSIVRLKNNLTTYQILLVTGFLILLDSIAFFSFIINYDFVFSLIVFSLCLLFLCEKRDIKKIDFYTLFVTLLITAILFKIKPHTAVFSLITYLASYLNSFKRYPYKFFIINLAVLITIIFLLPRDSIYFKYLSTFRPFSFNIVYPELFIYFVLIVFNLNLLFKKIDLKNQFLILSHLFLFVVSFIILRGIPDGNSHYYTYCLLLLSICLALNDQIFFKTYSNILNKYNIIILIILIFSSINLSYRSTLNILDYYKSIVIEPKNKETQNDILQIKKALNSVDIKNTFLYVEPEQKRIWNLVKECSSKAFLFPAYFEIPRILASPPAGFCPLHKSGYGYSAYTNTKSIKLTKIELCDYSKIFKIYKIINLRFDKEVEIENISCN